MGMSPAYTEATELPWARYLRLAVVAKMYDTEVRLASALESQCPCCCGDARV